MKCSIYTRNSINGPSDYYRIIQYVECMNFDYFVHDALNTKQFKTNLNINNKYLKKIYQLYLYIIIVIRRIKAIKWDLKNNVDLIIVQREIFPRFFPFFINKLLKKLFSKKRVLWDFDDDIFYSGEISKKETTLLLNYSDKIIGIGDYSCSLLPIEYHHKYISLPTTDKMFSAENIDKLILDRANTYQTNIDIIWLGTSSNLKNIDTIIAELDKVAKELKTKHKILKLNIVCNIPYKPNSKVENLEIENHIWSRELAKEMIKTCHIGIMPLVDSKFSKGKGGFKLIQYISSGMPVVASNVAYCKKVISDGCGFLCTNDKDWYDYIYKLSTNYELWFEYSYGAIKRYLSKFDYMNNLKAWDSLIFNELEDSEG